MCMFPPNLKQIGQKIWLQEPKNRQNGRYDVITSRRCYVMTFFTHGTMRLYRAHVSTKFEANRSKNMATGAEKPPKMTFLRHNVATLLRHDGFFHMMRCAHAICMFLPNLKQIGQKMRLQWPKQIFARS